MVEALAIHVLQDSHRRVSARPLASKPCLMGDERQAPFPPESSAGVLSGALANNPMRSFSQRSAGKVSPISRLGTTCASARCEIQEAQFAFGWNTPKRASHEHQRHKMPPGDWRLALPYWRSHWMIPSFWRPKMPVTPHPPSPHIPTSSMSISRCKARPRIPTARQTGLM